MGDVPVGAVSVPTTPVPPSGKASAPSPRAAKIAAVTAGLAKLASEQATPTEPPATEPVKPADPVPEAPKPVDPPADPPVEEKPAATDEATDPKTAKGLAAIDKQAKKFREEQARAKADLDLERAELARIRAEVTGKSSSLEELQRLVKKDPIAALAKLGLSTDDETEMERVGRGAYVYTKAGKADPRSKESASQIAEKSAIQAEIADLRKVADELRNEFKTRDQRASAETFVTRYLDGAVKAIPSEPTLIGKLYAKAPEKARQALHAVGAKLERENDNETPSHADVIAEYEKLQRAELEEQGVDVDAMLRPSTTAAPAKAPSKTLDIAAPSGTRPINGTPTRAEKLAAITAGLRKLDSAAT